MLTSAFIRTPKKVLEKATSLRATRSNPIEIVSKRTLNSKTFSLGGKARRLVQQSGQMHYYDGSSLKDVDFTMNDRISDFSTNKAPYTIQIEKGEIGYTYTSKAGGTINIRLVEINDTPVKNFTKTFMPTKSRNGAYGEIRFNDILPDLDIYFELRPRMVRIFKVLKSSAAPTVFTWEIIEDDRVNPFNVRLESVGSDNNDEIRKGREGERKLKRKIEINSTVGSIDTTINPGKRTFRIREEFTGRTAKLSRPRIPTWLEEVVYPVLWDQDITETIGADVDDGYEIVGDTIWVLNYNSVSNAFGYNSAYTAKANSGYRWTTVNIPKRAVIESADLRVNILARNGSPSCDIYFDDVDDAAEFANGNLPSGVTKTTAKTVFSPPGTGFQTADVKAHVQEIVNRSGWSANNAMRAALLDNVGTGINTAGIEDYAQSAANSARLTVDYSTISLLSSKNLLTGKLPHLRM